MSRERKIAMRVKRAALELSQIEVAQKAGIQFQRYNRIENGVYDPTPAEAKAIAKALKAKADDLFPEQVSA